MRVGLTLACALVIGCTATRQDLGYDDDAAVADAGASGVVRLAAGRRTSMALMDDGSVWAWGANGNGQLAIGLATTSTCTITPGTVSCAPTPTRVAALTGASDLGLGMEHGCALRSGRVSCWGLGIFGMLGNGRTADDPGPSPVDVGIDDAVGLAVGDWTSCAVHADGSVSCWGLATAGMLGLSASDLDACPVAAAWVARYELPFAAGSSLPCSLVPRVVLGLTDVAELGIGRDHLCALRTGGSVVCAGSAEAGQLGDGSTTAGRATFEEATRDASAVASGSAHTCAVREGALTCWGADGSGQAGAVPAPVACGGLGCVPSATALAPFGSGAIALGLGDRHTCAVVGTDAWCFGHADGGATGPRDTTCAEGPCRFPAGIAATGVRGPIAAGSEHTCAATLEGGVACWGEGGGGALGDGLRASSTTPVRIELTD